MRYRWISTVVLLLAIGSAGFSQEKKKADNDQPPPKKELASKEDPAHEELREVKKAMTDAFNKKDIDALSGNDIIDSYITCSGCGAKFVPLDGLDLIIKRARSTEQFIAAIASHTH